MNWKQVLFLGGAVMVLAACADATAPTSGLRKVNGSAAANSKSSPKGGTVTSDGLCGHYSVSVGDSTSVTCGTY